MPNFCVTMINTFQFSSCDAPWLATTRPQRGDLAVKLRDGLLTLTETRPNGSFGSRIYALQTVALTNATIFMILSRLPPQIQDALFFPAQGTIVLFDPEPGGKRRLDAVGTDMNARRCRGWIFAAREP